jgi:adenosylmethionine-8-amino-7-oxononanoate aminotransferase
MKTAEPPYFVKRGEGVYLELEDGSRVVDCISSWWVNIHGHAHPVIARAIYEQALTLEQVIFAGFTHAPAEQLAKRLLEHLPAELTSIFYSDNGSTAVEVALKMSYQYWRNRGEVTRRRFIGFEGGYHGDTLGAMSLGRGATFWRTFQDIMCQVDVIPFPGTCDGDDQVCAKEERSLKTLRELLTADPTGYAAICIEPLVQGAGGMKVCRPEFLQALVRTAREFGVLVIFDEVMTGFGRTGDWFASKKSATCPDIICISKGITGGFLPLAVTACKKPIFEAFLSDDPAKAFFQGHWRP